MEASALVRRRPAPFGARWWPVLQGVLGLRRGESPGPEEVVRTMILVYIIRRLARKALNLVSFAGGPAPGSEPKEKQEIKLRNQQFTLTAPTEEADLSWWGAAPSYVIPVAFGVEVLLRWLGVHKNFMKDPIGRTARLMFAVFALQPVIEGIVAHDWSNPSASQVNEGKHHDRRFRGSLVMWALVELGLTVSVTESVLDPRRKLSLLAKASAAVFLGTLNGGLGITVAHELLHKARRLDKVLAKALLTNVCYLHWADEHLVGHHGKVATPEDPATAAYGQSLYGFLPQTIIGSFVSSWGIYAARAGAAGHTASKATFVLKIFGPPVAWLAMLAAITRRRLSHVAAFFFVQTAISVGLLESVNYIEHYGLRRKKLQDGGYESVNPRHSWNSAHHLSNTILFKLQRHSDHHTFPTRPFQLLRNFEESPQLPTGYLGMVALSSFPPAFFHIMNPLVDAYNSGSPEDIKKASDQADQAFRRWSTGVFVCILPAVVAAKRRGLL